MLRTIGILVCGVAFGVQGSRAAQAGETNGSEIEGGIKGKIVKVDVEKQTVTIESDKGRERTFSITDETTMIGPRGGVVRQRLRDHRFHPGLSITVVATGNTATELHLGYDRKARAVADDPSRSAPNSPAATSENQSTPTRTRRSAGFRGSETKPETEENAAKADDEDNEFPGKVKSVDAAKRLLVITLLNGNDRSFLLSKDCKIVVGSHSSLRGLSDSAIRPGVTVAVSTEAGGRKVKEVKVTPATRRRALGKAA